MSVPTYSLRCLTWDDTDLKQPLDYPYYFTDL